MSWFPLAQSISVILLALLICVPASAEQYIVNIDGSGDFVTIQAAVDAAASGDQIIVAAGTYVADPRNAAVIHVQDKSLRIFSNSGPVATKINGQNSRRCVLVTGDANHLVQLQGFQILNGKATAQDVDGDGNTQPDECHGGGLLAIGNCRVEVGYCWFFDNYSEFQGGGLAAWESNIDVSDCRFINNVCDKGDGGALRADLSQIRIENCEFNTNDARSGGGIYSRLSSLEVLSTEFKNNNASLGGGAMSTSGTASFHDCQFRTNTANQAAAIHMTDMNASMEHCLFFSNMADTTAGVEIGHDCVMTILSSDFQSNKALELGGAISVSSLAETTIRFSRFCENEPVVIYGKWIDGNNNAFTDTCYCLGDFDQDGAVDIKDMLTLIENWGAPAGDIDGDLTTQVSDLLILLQRWGSCP